MPKKPRTYRRLITAYAFMINGQEVFADVLYLPDQEKEGPWLVAWRVDESVKCYVYQAQRPTPTRLLRQGEKVMSVAE